MVNIVGKYISIVLIASSGVSLYAAPVELKIRALDGAPLETAGVGVPFLVEVTAIKNQK